MNTEPPWVDPASQLDPALTPGAVPRFVAGSLVVMALALASVLSLSVPSAWASSPVAVGGLTQADDGDEQGSNEGDEADGGCNVFSGEFTLGDEGDATCVGKWLLAAGGVVLLGGLVVYAVLGNVFRFLPLSANEGLRGSLRRAREQIPVVGRAYRAVVTVDVLAANGEVTERSRTFAELLVDEMSNASRTGGFSERISGEPPIADLVTVLDGAPTGVSKAMAALAKRLPQERFRLRVQLLESLPEGVSVAVELIDRKGQGLDSAVLDAGRPTGDDGERLGHEVLVAGTAAWFAYRMYDESPGSAEERPRPVNTADPESYGEFREGVTFEKLHQPDRARTSYLRAIDLDPANVGALVNLALLDMRDRARIARSMVQLRNARAQVDGIQDPRERALLLGRIQYVTALVSLNRLALHPGSDPTNARPLLAAASSAVRNVARLVDRASHIPPLHLPWQKAEQDEISAGLQAYRSRTIAVAAGLAVERERIGATRGVGRSTDDPVEAVRIIARGGRLSFPVCRRLVQRPESATVSSVAYSLACAHARRGEAAEAVALVRDALQADPELARWTVSADGDPSFDEIRTTAEFRALVRSFSADSGPERARPQLTLS